MRVSAERLRDIASEATDVPLESVLDDALELLHPGSSATNVPAAGHPSP
jgi:hypothetical protein